MRTRGFTILELLMVVGIIALLIAAMFASLAKLRQRTAMGQARNLVEKCSNGLETYNLTFRAYPSVPNADPSPGKFASNQLQQNSEALLYFLGSAFRRGANTAKGEIEATINVGPLVTFEEREICTKSGKSFIIDPWSTPVHFVIVEIPDSTNPLLKTKSPRVYSYGVNQSDDLGAGDDIGISR